METEYWAHHYAENPNKDEVVDDSFSVEDAMKELGVDPDDPDDWETV